MANLWVRSPNPADVDQLADNLRMADQAEIAALYEDPLPVVIQRSLDVSSHQRAFGIQEQLLGLMGVAPLPKQAKIGIPWLLGTRRLERFPKALTKLVREQLWRAHEPYPHLINVVDARQKKAIRWLKALGFHFSETPVRLGLYQLPFYCFERRRNDV